MAQTKRTEETSGLNIAWTTVSYRAVFLIVVALLAAAFVVFALVAPQQSKRMWDSAIAMLPGVPAPKGSADSAGIKAGQQEAHFTAIDGTVRVRRGNSSSWETASYNMPLQRGDVVQTSSEGMAKITFVDGTNYTIKPDSLIVIEENSANGDQQTNVSVQVTAGMVDLATGTYSQGSKSQVVIAGATATFAPDTAARVHNDNRSDTHEVLIAKGSGELNRNGEVTQISRFEQVAFKANTPGVIKTRELAPPTLVGPANMAPLFSSNNTKQVDFTWTPIDSAHGYHIRVSRNPYFTSVVVDKKTTQPSLTGVDLAEGNYYWSVQSLDASGKESVESERDRFSVVPRSSSSSLALNLDELIQHGHVIEVVGKTEPTARVMVNGDEVPMVSGDGSFHYFTPPMPAGESVITVTAQNAKGGVNTVTKKVLVQ